MKVNLYLLITSAILGFVGLLFQDEAWSKFITIPCGLYIGYSFIALTYFAINSYRRK